MEDQIPLVSIIIPTYNRAHIIGETLDSVQNQTYQNWECIVVDDMSTDNTDEIMQQRVDSDTRVHYYKRNREPKGAPTCRNIGLDIAQGEYVIFLDSDDLFLPCCLENRIKYFLKNEKLDVLISLQKRLENGKETFYVNVRTNDHPLLRFYALKPEIDIPWVNNSCCIRKTFLSQNKIRWDESVQLYQDIQFNLKLLSFDPKLEWSKDDFDCYWTFSKDVKNLGNTNIISFDNTIKILEIYWLQFKKYEGSFKLKKQIESQFYSMAISYSIHCIKRRKPIELSKLIIFFKSYSLFNFSTLLILKISHRLISKRRLYLHRLILRKNEEYLTIKFKPVIKKGNFCKIAKLHNA